MTSAFFLEKVCKSYEYSKAYILSFYKYKFFDGELKMCLSLIWYCL